MRYSGRRRSPWVRSLHAWAVAAAIGLALVSTPDAQTQVQGTLAVGTSSEIRAALSKLGLSADLVPADRLLDAYEPKLFPDLIRTFRLDPSQELGGRRPFVIFDPDTPLPSLESQLLALGVDVEQPPPVQLVQPGLPRPSDCLTCLPVAPGLPGSIDPLLLPKLQLTAGAFSAAQCAASATKLRGRIQAEPDCYKGSGIDVAYCSAPLAAAGYFTDYTKSCLLKAEQFSDPNLSQFAVLVPAGSSTPFCGALLVTPTTAITSAHCFFNQSIPGSRLRPWTNRDLEIGVSFHEGTEDIASLPLNEYPVVLRLSSAVPGAHSDVCFEDPALKDPLQLFGYLDPTGPVAPADWRGNIRSSPFACSAVSASATTFAATLPAGCYKHSCQAFGGFSGAPIFKDGAQLGCSTLVVGMHVGGGGATTACSDGQSNSALTGGLLRKVIASISESKEP